MPMHQPQKTTNTKMRDIAMIWPVLRAVLVLVVVAVVEVNRGSIMIRTDSRELVVVRFRWLRRTYAWLGVNVKRTVCSNVV